MSTLAFLEKYSPKKIGLLSLLMMIISMIFGFYAMPKFIDSNIQKLNLKPGSEMRSIWQKAPFALTFKVYLFNLTNPLQVVQGDTPIVKEVGPYVFDEWKHKENTVDHEEEDAVSFDMVNTYIFRPDLTKGSVDDVVIIPHVFMMSGLIATKRDRSGFLAIVINAFKQIFQPEETPFLTTKIMDILFDGVGIDCNREELEASVVCPNLASEKQIKVINETYYSISLFGSKNATSLGRFKVNRGVRDIKKVGKVISFNGKPESTAFKGSCNLINGTDGTIFAPYLEKSNTIYSFSPAFCRSLGMTFVREANYNSVPTSIFTINFNDLKGDSSQHCFCRQEKQENCPPKGVFDMYPCTGAPLLSSKPHFLDADPQLLRQVKGLKPDKRKHELKLEFEMMTGSPVTVTNRIQFSMDVEPIEEFDLMANMKKSIIPVFWIEESMSLDKKITNTMRYGLYWTQTGSAVIKYSGMLLGFLGMIYASYKMFMQQSLGTKPNEPPSGIQTIQPSGLSGINDTKY